MKDASGAWRLDPYADRAGWRRVVVALLVASTGVAGMTTFHPGTCANHAE